MDSRSAANQQQAERNQLVHELFPTGREWDYTDQGGKGKGFFAINTTAPVSSAAAMFKESACLSGAFIASYNAKKSQYDGADGAMYEKPSNAEVPYLFSKVDTLLLDTDASDSSRGMVVVTTDAAENGIGHTAIATGPYGHTAHDFSYGSGSLVDLKPGEAATPQQNADAFRAVFGVPPKMPEDPYNNYPRTNYDFPKSNEGRDSYSSDVMIQQILYADIWHMTEALPWKKHDGPGSTIKLDLWIYDDSISTRTPYETTSRLVTSRVETMESEVVRWGGSHLSERQFWLRAMGRQDWTMQQQQLKNGALTSQMLNVITELLTCHGRRGTGNADSLEDRMNLMYDSIGEEQILQKELYIWDIVKREKDGLDHAADEIQTILRNRKVAFTPRDLLLIIPDGVARYTASRPEHRDFILTGKPRETFDDYYNNFKVRGFEKVRVQPPIVVNSRGKPILPLSAIRTIGGSTEFMHHKCRRFGRDFRTADLDHHAYFEHSNRRENMPYVDMMRNTGLWTVHGITTPHIGIPAFFNYEKCEMELQHIRHINAAQGIIPSESKLIMYRDPKANPAYRNIYNNLEGFPGLQDAIIAGVNNQPDANRITEVYWLHTAGSYFKRYLNDASELQQIYDGFHRLSRVQRDEFVSKMLFNEENRWTVNGVFGNDGGNPLVRDPATGFYEPFDENALKRALDAVLLETNHFWEFCFHNNITTWLNGRAASPHRTYRTHTLIGMIHGSRTGNTFVGQSDYTVGQQATTKMIYGSLAFHSRAWVFNNKNVVLIQNAFVTQYLGGHTNEYWQHTVEDLKQYLDNKTLGKSLFAIFTPPDFRRYQPERYEINGSRASGDNRVQVPEITPQEMARRENGGRPDLSHPLAELYNAVWKFPEPHMSSYQNPSPYMSPAKHNGLCFQSFQLNVDAQGKSTEYILNAGHFGPWEDQGARNFRCGMSQYEKPVYMTGGCNMVV